MELAFLKKRKKLMYKQETWMGTISLIIAFLALLYLNIILLIQETFIGKGFLQIVGIGVVCSVLGMITKSKSRKYALWACSLFVFILLFAVFGFMLGWMISFGP
jgi:bacteriorhodopsin